MVQDTAATALFGLAGVEVVEVDTEPDDSMTVYAQTAVTVVCPDCAAPASRVKERVTGGLGDVPYGGRRIRVGWWKRRWSLLRDVRREHVGVVPGGRVGG